MEHLRMIIRGLERQLDNIHRELDYRAAVMERDREDINGFRARLRIMEQVIPVIIERVKALEAGSPMFRMLEIVSPLILIGLAIVYRVPLSELSAVLGAIK